MKKNKKNGTLISGNPTRARKKSSKRSSCQRNITIAAGLFLCSCAVTPFGKEGEPQHTSTHLYRFKYFCDSGLDFCFVGPLFEVLSNTFCSGLEHFFVEISNMYDSCIPHQFIEDTSLFFWFYILHVNPCKINSDHFGLCSEQIEH